MSKEAADIRNFELVNFNGIDRFKEERIENILHGRVVRTKEQIFIFLLVCTSKMCARMDMNELVKAREVSK